MPMPTPKPSEDKTEFISRCMSNDTMLAEFPDAKDRRAVCETQWKNEPPCGRGFEGECELVNGRCQTYAKNQHHWCTNQPSYF